MMTLEKYLSDCEPKFSQTLNMLGCVFDSPGYHTKVPDGTWAHRTRDNGDYAIALLKSGIAAHLDRAEKVLRVLLSSQETDPTEATFGIWPWVIEEPVPQMAPPDWNWADFIGMRLAHVAVEYRDRVEAQLLQEIHSAIGRAAWSIFRRNIQSNYTNIAIMGGGLCCIAGEVLNEPRLLDYGRRRLANLVRFVDFHGSYAEYNSPHYTKIAAEECDRILQLTRDDDVHASAETLRRLAWKTIAEHFHVPTQQWAPPHARAYSDRITPALADYLSDATGVKIVPHDSAIGEPEWSPIQSTPCPSELTESFRSTVPFPRDLICRYTRREPDAESSYATTWFSERACLGSMRFGSFWTQQRLVQAYWKSDLDSAVVLRLRFMNGARDFSTGSARNLQEGPSVRSAFELLPNHGDFHLSLDRPGDGIFHVSDVRIRYELRGKGVRAEKIGENQFALIGDPLGAYITTTPDAQFGPHPVKWIINQEKDYACIDGICYLGETLSLDPTKLVIDCQSTLEIRESGANA